MRVLVAAESGRLRDGLLAILNSSLTPQTVVVVDDAPSALEAIRCGHFDLLILDADFATEDMTEFSCDFKQEKNGVRCLVVADRLGQIKRLLQAGADKVLLKGFSALELSTAVTELFESSTD